MSFLLCKSTKNLEFPMKMGQFNVFCVAKHATKRSGGPFLDLGSKLKLIVNYRNLIAELGKN